MATGKNAASKAAKQLRSSKSTAAEQTVAASALSQAPDHTKKAAPAKKPGKKPGKR